MIRSIRIFAVLAAMAAGTVAVSAQTVTVRTERTVTTEHGRYESRRDVKKYSSRDFWKKDRWSVRGGMAMPSYTAESFAEGSFWNGSFFWRDRPNRNTLSDIYADYNGFTRSTGAVTFGADYMFARWFALSVDLSTTFVWHDTYDGISSVKTGTKTGVVLCLMPQAKFIYLNRPVVRLYGKFGLGVVKYFGFDRRDKKSFDDDVVYLYSDNSSDAGFQWVPFGIEVGRKFYGFTEFGIGTLYRGIFAGVGYKF